MLQIRSSNPPLVTGICDPNKFRAWYHRSLKGSVLQKWLKTNEFRKTFYLRCITRFWLNFLRNDWPTKDTISSQFLTFVNLWHAVNKIWTCADLEFRLCWMKLCSSCNHYTSKCHCSFCLETQVLRSLPLIKHITLHNKNRIGISH